MKQDTQAPQPCDLPGEGRRHFVLHVILNSHLDPVWLWNRAQGEDAAIATARTTCDLLDEYPEIHATRGAAWFYETVARFDPATFRRMRRHVADGRLHVVGGWYVQPDCNLASPSTYALHDRVAGEWFRRRLGAKARTGYNVDSFGHAATLPDFYAAAGIENYLFMRPDPHEKPDLPGEVFRWRGPSGSEVLAARIPVCYTTNNENVLDFLAKAAGLIDPALGHGLFFCGVGDHGGGPTRAEIDAILAHRNDFPGVEVRFSHPDAFFDAVRASKGFRSLPVYEGELQHHAIGCYSAFSTVKRDLRRTEALAERSMRRLPVAARAEVERSLLFASFHDILAGTCIESAYRTELDDLAAARHALEKAEADACRRRTALLPPHPFQRIVADNLGSETYDGLAEFEPWVLPPSCGGPAEWHLETISGKPVHTQMLPQESVTEPRPRIVFPAHIAAGRRLVMRIVDGAASRRAELCALPSPSSHLPCQFSFAVLNDASDTWSHGLKGYADRTDAPAMKPLGKPVLAIDGPLVREERQRYEDSEGNWADLAVRGEAGLPGVRLRIRLVWRTPRRIVKLNLTPGFPVLRRLDGIPGGMLRRKLDGEEYPVFGFCRLEGAGDRSLTAVSSDVFACDVLPDGLLRLTLLRTPYFAHHHPTEPTPGSLSPVTDLGDHFYDIALLENADEAAIRRELFRQTHPLRFSETTRGMSAGHSAVPGVVVRGHGVASGKGGDPRFPGGTIALQAPYFKELGLDLSGFHLGTINVNVAPLSFKPGPCALLFERVKWHPQMPAETFSFARTVLVHKGIRHPAYIYLPHPETKAEHFQPGGVVEIIAPRIEGLAYGNPVTLESEPGQARWM